MNGVQQKPIEGVSMAYSFDNGDAAERRPTQYFEMFCNRGIYHEGWTAVTRHGTPWILSGDKKAAFDEDVWELYDTNTDYLLGIQRFYVGGEDEVPAISEVARCALDELLRRVAPHDYVQALGELLEEESYPPLRLVT